MADVAWFFSKMAVVTFGGAYAVLAYVAQEAVGRPCMANAGRDAHPVWGLAETTPGPLVLVLQFVGFLAGYGAAGLRGAVVASMLTLWVTFAPCFAFVFLGAPAIERLQNNATLSGALAAITAAVVGVIANLALWFGLRVDFQSSRAVRLGTDCGRPAGGGEFGRVGVGDCADRCDCALPIQVGNPADPLYLLCCGPRPKTRSWRVSDRSEIFGIPRDNLCYGAGHFSIRTNIGEIAGLITDLPTPLGAAFPVGDVSIMVDLYGTLVCGASGQRHMSHSCRTRSR